ncbi:integrase [Treponema pedis str. T A4]|uniref:Integrase n=1 Tax=Treponema pedis str. T A4 TaxID=1291379 RepID=S5ZMF6_9SPIR|nr:integrase [Treponema pedis str. T A4]
MSLKRHVKSEPMKSTTVKTYKSKLFGCGFFRCTCVQNISFRLFKTISITFFDWDERKPGFFEVDTVVNCGISTKGQYICTLTLTDVHFSFNEDYFKA